LNLTEFEAVAGNLLKDQKRLEEVVAELEALSQEMRQDPKRNEKDRAFYALIGLDWTDPGHKSMAESLRSEKEALERSISGSKAALLEGISSHPFVVPLDPTPRRGSGDFSFKFRSGATFPNTVEELSLTLGIPAPLRIGDVTIRPDAVVVAESDEYFAKKKVVEAFEDIRKAVKLKLSA
jgi:hypothetical protein